MLQTIGKRIAQYRNELGWTQQYLAERLAISRVAVSHIEMDISIPGERTITLLSGLFKTNPHFLVENTTYPQAKTERLPLISCSFTKLECELMVLKNDLEWMETLVQSEDYGHYRELVKNKWLDNLEKWKSKTVDPVEKTLIEEAFKLLRLV